MSFRAVMGWLHRFVWRPMACTICQRASLNAVLICIGLLCPAVAYQLVVSVAAVSAVDFSAGVFHQFYTRYATYLGAPVTSAVESDGVLIQWFRYARLEYQTPRDASPHPDFPEFSLAPLGREAMMYAGLSEAPGLSTPDIVRIYLTSRTRDDFLQSIVAIGPTLTRDFPVVIQDFGSAPFHAFYDLYSQVLGESVSQTSMYKGFIAQWFRYGRVEYHPEYGTVALHPQFPKLQLGLLGREYLEQEHLAPDLQPIVAPILARWLTLSALQQDILYLYGNPLTNPLVDIPPGYTTQVFERAVFQWRTGATEPQDVLRKAVGVELFSALTSSPGLQNQEEAREAFRRYFYGEPLAQQFVHDRRVIRMYFTRAVLEWPTGSTDPTQVRQVPIGAESYAQLNTPPPSPWNNLNKLLFLAIGGALLGLAVIRALRQRPGTQIYGRV